MRPAGQPAGPARRPAGPGARRARLAAMLVRAYPRSWRERYGDEVLAWVEEGGARGLAATRRAGG